MENTTNEKDEIIYQLSEDEYSSIITALNMYKEKYELAEKMLQNEKENVAELLFKIEALEDRVKELEDEFKK